MKVLIACEESQRVCSAFRNRGHEAYSCDLQPCSGGHPEWHIQGDVIPILSGNTWFMTMDGNMNFVDGKWDLLIAHPPCTYLSNVGNRYFTLKDYSINQINDRWLKRGLAAVFFMRFIFADCLKIAVENPVGIMSNWYRKPDQIIHPYYFTDPESEEYVSKATCLWLKGLPQLISPVKHRFNNAYKFGISPNGKANCWESCQQGSVNRSKTFIAIAQAMADQWG